MSEILNFKSNALKIQMAGSVHLTVRRLIGKLKVNEVLGYINLELLGNVL